VHVLHVSEVTWGGVVSLLYDVMSEQVDRGHRVSLLVPRAFPESGLGRVQRASWAIDRRRPITFARALAQLRGTVRRERPDVVHLHSAYAGFFGRLPGLSGTSAVPVIYQPHAWSFDLFTEARVRRLLMAWERAASRWTDVLVTNCKDEIDEGRRIGIATPGHALGVPVDVKRFHPVGAAEQHRQRQALGLGDRKTLLCLGRLARQKGQDRLVEAWEAAPLSDTQLLLVGPGDPDPLRRLAPTQWGRTIRWVGDQTDVRPFLWACDVLVLPSRYETVAVVVAEAMACGKPVVANRVNGVDMAVADGPSPAGGTVINAGDMDALLAESGRLLDDPQLRTSLGEAGTDRVFALFTPDLVIDRLDEAYEHALKEKR